MSRTMVRCATSPRPRLTSLADGSSADGRDRRPAVRNHTGHAIYYICLSNTGDDDWREDLLVYGVLLDSQE